MKNPSGLAEAEGVWCFRSAGDRGAGSDAYWRRNGIATQLKFGEMNVVVLPTNVSLADGSRFLGFQAEAGRTLLVG